MLTIEYINKKLDHMESVKKAKAAIANGLKIEWETDPEKMEFEKLRSYQGLEDFFKSELLRIEEFNIAKSYNCSRSIEDLISRGDTSFIELVNILVNGGKLIPPAVCEFYAMVDGQEKKLEGPHSLCDGYHRATLARAFGLDVVPSLVFKECNQYWFSPDKYKFEGGRIKEEQEDGAYIEFDGVRVTSTGGEIFTFHGNSYLGDGDGNYIIIHKR